MNRVILRTLQVVLPLAVLGAAGFAAVTMVRNRPPVETQAPVFTPPGVRVHEVALGQVPMSVTSQGTVRPRTESQLVPEIAGRITWVAPSFAEGGFFDAGDVLVKIDPFDYEQALVSARSQLAQARLRLAQEEAEAEVAEREWNDLGRGDPRELTLRKPQLDDARASVAAAEANVIRAERDLERAQIIAPYAGRIRTKNVDIGQFVRVGDSVATVYSVDVAEVRLPLPDDQIAYLNLPLSYRGVDQQPQPHVTLRATFAGETHEWQGRIVRTESEIDPVSRMVHVVAEVNDPYAPSTNLNRPPLAVGMYVEAEIEGRTVRNVAIVPRSALRGREQVLVVDAEDRLSFRDIDIFRATTDAVYVRSGLTEGELIVVSPLDTPTDGMMVQIADADPALLARRAGATPETADPEVTPDTTPPAAPTPDPTPTEPVAVAETAPAAPAPPEAAPPTEGPAERPAWLDSLSADRRETAPEPATPERDAAPARPSTPPAGAPTPTTPEPPPPPPPTPVAAVEEPSAGPNAVAVGRFASLSGDDSAVLGQDIASAVADRLNAADGIHTAPRESDARYIVGGGIQQVGPMVRVTARIVDTADGSVLQALKIDGTADERDALAAQVASAVFAHANLFRGAGDVAAASSGRALAVLPFDDLSAAPGTSTDVDLGAAITGAVSQRMSSLSFVQLVASNVEADWVVSGGIQRIGDIVRVTARLVDVDTGAVVQAIKVDGTVDALDALQTEVAAAIAESVEQGIGRQA